MILRTFNPDQRRSLVDIGIIPLTYRIQTRQHTCEGAGKVSISRASSPLICLSSSISESRREIFSAQSTNKSMYAPTPPDEKTLA
jgi:hypothetical protein